MRRILFLLLLVPPVLSGQTNSLIPRPIRIRPASNVVRIGGHPDIVTKNGFGKKEAEFLTEALARRPSDSSGAIIVEQTPGQAGSYSIEPVPPSVIKIKAPDTDGVFNAVQTLLQLLPAASDAATLPAVSISDTPKFAWRGLHLDCARHFFPTDFIKKYLDYMAMYKLNVFHWHLTDDQGWRIEIKKYPKLTSVGAWRKGTMIGPYADQKVDNKPYGGFYTQDDIRDIVAYAAARHITIVPEIEMPGHASAALAAYPEYSCTGKQVEVATTWGVFEDVFCPKEETFKFLGDILDEVMALFPSKYIHIGGDECPKVQWKSCDRCQSLIKSENLGDEAGLQSYFIRRIEKYLNARGRRVIGWNEILEGGLAPNAAVMSWQGTDGGVRAAKEGHDVVMTPESFLYFDRYQGDARTEPLAFGGYVPIEKTYGFNPVPSYLTPEQARHIIGVQANLWTEYIPDEKQAEYMLFPRIAALAEVAWGTAIAGDFPEFQKRVEAQFPLWDKLGIRYSRALYDVKIRTVALHRSLGVAMSANGENPEIWYTRDGSEPNANSPVFSSPVEISSGTVKAARFENGRRIGNTASVGVSINKASGKDLTLKEQPNPGYPGDGAFTLVNGISGDKKRPGNDWIGFEGTDMEAVIDLADAQKIKSATLSFMQSAGSWIYYPRHVVISVSLDNVSFKPLAETDAAAIEKAGGTIKLNLKKAKARYVKIAAENTKTIADGNPGAGHPAWIFADEISID